jgi:endonuclease-3
MTKTERLHFIDSALESLYPNPKPFLEFKTPYQLLVAVILSAQCTDARVNIVTKKLFADRPGPNAILDLGQTGLISYIRSCGYFNAKSKNILAMTKILIEEYRGEVPKTMEELVKLPGVGEKTAGVVMSQAFDIPSFPVDTHVFRLAHRLGLSKHKDPDKVSADLKKRFPKNRWIELHMQVILHGRQVCIARSPRCSSCTLLPICTEGKSRAKKQ